MARMWRTQETYQTSVSFLMDWLTASLKESWVSSEKPIRPLGPLVHFIGKGKYDNIVVWSVLISIHPFFYGGCKSTYSWDRTIDRDGRRFHESGRRCPNHSHVSSRYLIQVSIMMDLSIASLSHGLKSDSQRSQFCLSL